MNDTMTSLVRIAMVILLAVLSVALISPALAADDSLLTVDRIYKKGDFKAKRYPARWLEDSSGYVRENDIYVEDLRDGSITRLTKKSSNKVINGTFDWVYTTNIEHR